MNKILLIEISSLKFYFMSIFLDFLKKILKESHKSTLYTFDLFSQFFFEKI